MKYKEFEKQIKVKLEGATEHVDIDALIQGIHSNDKDGKKKFGFWFISLLTLGVLITFGYGFIKNTQSQTPIDNASNIVLATNNTRNTRNIETQNLQVYKIEKENKIKGQNTKIQNKENGYFDAKMSKDNSKNDVNIIKEKYKQTTDNNTVRKNIKNDKKNSYFLISKKNANNVGNNKIKPNKVLSQSDINTDADNYKNKKSQPVSNISMSLNKAIEIKKIEKREIQLTHFNNLKMNDPECYNFSSRASFNWKLGVELGVSNPLKGIENTGKFNQIYDLREKYEKPLEGLSASIFARGSIGKNPLYLKLGGSYTRIADNLETSFLTTRMDTTQGIISITKSENGDTLTIITGDIISEITTQRDVKKHYYFHLYDVPVGIGYDFDLGFLKLGIEAGVILNVYNGTSGSILKEKDTFVDADNSGLFKKNIGIRYYGRINLTKAMSDNSHILLGAKFQYTQGTFSAEDNAIKQSYNLLGVRLGYMYGF